MFFDNDPLLFFPTASGAETLAYHPPHQGVAGATLERVMTLVESWELRYGAELVANHGTIMQFSVHRPPCTLEESWEIAIEHELIAPDTLWLPGVTLREHARKLINNPCGSCTNAPDHGPARDPGHGASGSRDDPAAPTTCSLSVGYARRVLRFALVWL